MTLYSLCTLATCDVYIMNGVIPKIRIDHEVGDIEHVYNIDFLRRKIERIGACRDNIQVWLEEE